MVVEVDLERRRMRQSNAAPHTHTHTRTHRRRISRGVAFQHTEAKLGQVLLQQPHLIPERSMVPCGVCCQFATQLTRKRPTYRGVGEGVDAASATGGWVNHADGVRSMRRRSRCSARHAACTCGVHCAAATFAACASHTLVTTTSSSGNGPTCTRGTLVTTLSIAVAVRSNTYIHAEETVSTRFDHGILVRVSPRVDAPVGRDFGEQPLMQRPLACGPEPEAWCSSIA